MKAQKIILVALFGMFLLNSCKYECPCFDKSLLVWMPQEYGDKIQFTNQNNSDTLTFTVTKKEYTDSYKIQRQNRESCDAYAELIASNDALLYSISFDKPYQSDYILDGGIRLNYNVAGGFTFSFSDINKLTKKYIINNKSYNAITFEQDTTANNNEIYKIILAEDYGLLQFYEKSGEVWTLIEK